MGSDRLGTAPYVFIFLKALLSAFETQMSVFEIPNTRCSKMIAKTDSSTGNLSALQAEGCGFDSRRVHRRFTDGETTVRLQANEPHSSTGCVRNKARFESLVASLEASLPRLPKHQLVEVRKLVTAQFVKRFKKSHIPKYGSINKGFTEQELRRFFSVIENPKFRLLFSYQAQMGLRVGEALRINIRDIRFESRELVVKTEKAMTLDALLIPAPLFKETLEYIESNTKGIEGSGGYLFFKEQGKSTNPQPYMDAKPILFSGVVKTLFINILNR